MLAIHALSVALIAILFSAAAPVPRDSVRCDLDYTTGSQICIVQVDETGASGDTTSASMPNTNAVSRCSFRGLEIPCTGPDGGSWWYLDMGCYVSAVSPAPPVGDAVWQGRTTGGIYSCVAGPAGQPWPGSMFWLPAQPGGPGAPPDPAQVARRAIDQMQLRRITIGMVPESGPDRVGIVGIPAWMWVADRSDQTFGPITRTASSGSVSVTATGRVEKIVWDMGDGSKVTCTTAGTPFYDGAGGTKSPDCGYVYSKQGTYTVTATSYWEVTWSGGGQSGTIPLTMASSTTVVIGELQAVTR